MKAKEVGEEVNAAMVAQSEIIYKIEVPANR